MRPACATRPEPIRAGPAPSTLLEVGAFRYDRLVGGSGWIVSLVSLLVLGGCGFVQDWSRFTVPGEDAGPDVDAGPCAPEVCPGCCQGGVCMGGDSTAACGARGRVCVGCGTGEMCAGGACVPEGVSCPDPAGCPTGCCVGATCMPGNTASACGASGGSCEACGGDETCSAGGCVPGGCSVRDTGSGFEDTCTDETICNCSGGTSTCEGTGTCVAAFGRIYRIGIIRVLLPDRAPGGGCWDGGCGDPDPFVIVTIDGTEVGTTSNGSGVFDYTWDPVETFDARVLAGTDVLLEVWDEDVTIDDFAFRCSDDPITPTRLRSRALGCGDATSDLTAVILFAP